jgi:tetratricopeptide (TPR) repeat protein
VRALWHHAKGDRAGEARELAASGDMAESANILAAGTDPAAAAALFENAGEHKRAADAYHEAGDLVAAARNFESAYDYENAIDCYRDLGDWEKVMYLLETTGDYFAAAQAAAAANQPDRAISNYQQVDSRHPHYGEVCREMAGLLAARGHSDLAIEKFNEALEIGGDEALPLETLLGFGQILEENGRGAEALDVYERIRRRDLNYSNISTRIEGLRDDATRLAGATTAPQASASPAAPEEARYEMIEELGRGGMGVVYRARDKHLGRIIAMKFLPDNLQQHPTAVKLFLREARATAALNHPNIVTMYDAAQQEGRYFISMECLEGVGLDEVLKKRGPLPAKLLAQLGMQVCAGLDYAHRNRIVHRDIKPSNLFVTKDRVLKIMDFGLAKAVEEVRRNSTVIGGTPNFMAPEQASGEPVDARTDLYSLGATLFQLVTGTVPFEEGDVAYHHRHTAPPDARERLATVPPELAELLLKMMAKAPTERVQSAAEVGARLKQIFEAN